MKPDDPIVICKMWQISAILIRKYTRLEGIKNICSIPSSLVYFLQQHFQGTDSEDDVAIAAH